MNELYVIQSIEAPHLYWNNKSGWGYLSTALVCNFRESSGAVSLPVGGQWLTLDQAIAKLENIAEAHGADL